jgi:hypothetical protein
MTGTPPENTGISFRARDVDKLIDAVSQTAPNLTSRQRDLLLSIFATAAGHVTAVGEDEKQGTIPKAGIKDGGKVKYSKDKEIEALREQLLHAYIPGGPPGGNPFRDMVQPPRHT